MLTTILAPMIVIGAIVLVYLAAKPIGPEG